MSLPIVAIVGRPNVGKSSLFNRILKRRLAVVDPISGVTRDRNYAIADWNGVSFSLVDTGGIVPGTRDLMEKLIADQAEFAIAEAELILLVVDTQTGADTHDLELARKLVRSKKPCLLIANKSDTEALHNQSFEMMSLGMGEPIPVSATEGLGIGELLDEMVKKLPKPDENAKDGEGVIKIAVVGRPNVGKSSFINKLLGEDRLIVSTIAGTTRDAVNSYLEFEGSQFMLIDTAGLRRKYRVAESIEFYTTLRTARAIESCDVGAVLVDATAGMTSQDQRILNEVLENRRGCILVINKWDLIEKDSKTADKFTADLKDILAHYAFVPIVYISALSGQRIAKVLSIAKQVYANQNKRIDTHDLNEMLQRAIGRSKPPAKQGKFIQIKYVTQSEIAPPTFIFFCNLPKLVDKTYISYLTNQIRAEFGFEGVPIRIKFRDT